MIAEITTALALASLAGSPGAARDTIPAPPLPLAEVVASAVATHPTLEAARARAVAADAEAGQARAALWPELGLAAMGTQYEEPMVVAPLHGLNFQNLPDFDETLYQGHASAGYTLFDGGARRSRIGAAAAHAEAAEASVRAASASVVAEAVTSYLAVLSAREVQTAHRLQVTALEAELARSSLLFEEGKAARVAVLRGEAALSEARAGLEAGEEDLRLAVQRLVRISGLPAERVAAEALEEIVPADAGELNREALVARALEANPRLSEARQRVAAAGLAVGAARAAFLPRVDLSGRYSAFGSAATDPALEWQTGIQVSYPVFAGGARIRGVERAQAMAGAAEADFREAEWAVADAVDAALAGHRSARARASALAAAVAQSAEVARIESLALEAGAGVQTDYLRSEAALLRARAGWAEARHAVVATRVRLAQLTGDLDDRWLARFTEGVEP